MAPRGSMRCCSYESIFMFVAAPSYGASPIHDPRSHPHSIRCPQKKTPNLKSKDGRIATGLSVLQCGSPADPAACGCLGPVALRPTLTSGLPLSLCFGQPTTRSEPTRYRARSPERWAGLDLSYVWAQTGPASLVHIALQARWPLNILKYKHVRADNDQDAPQLVAWESQ